MHRTFDLNSVAWRQSTYSDGGDGNCVQVAAGFPGVVPVRDSKVPDGPVLIVPSAAWGSFVASLLQA